MKPVNELTDMELRREIAEALGYFVMWWFNHLAWQARKDGEIIAHGKNAKTYDECWDRFFETGIVPNWPGDIGAAFELMRDVLDRLNSIERRRWHTWKLSYALGGFMLVLDNEDDRILIEYEATGETARALSELALLALRDISRRRENDAS